MDGKLEQIKYKGIERNSAEESATSWVQHKNCLICVSKMEHGET